MTSNWGMMCVNDISRWRSWGNFGQPLLWPKFEPGTSPIWNRSFVCIWGSHSGAAEHSSLLWFDAVWAFPDVSKDTTNIRKVGSDSHSDTFQKTLIFRSSVHDRWVRLMKVRIGYPHTGVLYVPYTRKACPDNNGQLWDQPTLYSATVERTASFIVGPHLTGELSDC